MRLTLQFKFTDAQLLQFHYEDGVGIPIPEVGDRVMRRAIDSVKFSKSHHANLPIQRTRDRYLLPV
jgi:hypothetical protein